jgi:hypothetical protein
VRRVSVRQKSSVLHALQIVSVFITIQCRGVVGKMVYGRVSLYAEICLSGYTRTSDSDGLSDARHTSSSQCCNCVDPAWETVACKGKP